MLVGDVQPVELLAHVTARRARDEDEQLRNRCTQPVQHRHQRVRPFHQLRLPPVAEPDAVLEERADRERRARNAQQLARSGPRGWACDGETREVDTDRNAEDPVRRDSGVGNELVHLRMRYLNSVDAGRMLLERLISMIEFRVAGSSRTAVEVAEAEPVGRLEPTRLQRAEMVVVKDGLPTPEPCPGRWR